MDTKNFVLPNFQHSIVNVAATLADFVGNPTGHTILPELKKHLKSSYKNIVFMVIDGMGSAILENNLPQTSFFRTHIIDEVTSVFPSTTAAATTSLISALTPAEHGWFAWSVDFDGEVIELFRNRNFYTHEFTNNRNFAMENLPYRKFFDDIKIDRTVWTCYPDNLSSKIHAPNEAEFHSLRHMFRCLKNICRRPEKQFIYTYFADLDSTMHSYGTTAFKSWRLLKKIERKTKRLAAKFPDTLFVITADHGQTDVKGFTYLCDDAEIQACLAHPISLDPRGACFFIQPDKHAEFQKAFQKYAQDFTLYKTDEMVEQGIFGDLQKKPQYRKHLGDYIAVGGDTNRILVFSPGDQYHGNTRLYHGIHTGMTKAEMMVPVIVLNGEK